MQEFKNKLFLKNNLTEEEKKLNDIALDLLAMSVYLIEFYRSLEQNELNIVINKNEEGLIFEDIQLKTAITALGAMMSAISLDIANKLNPNDKENKDRLSSILNQTNKPSD